MPDLRVRELAGGGPADRAADLPRRLPEAADGHRQPGGRAHHVRRAPDGPASPQRGGGRSERTQPSTACGQRRRRTRSPRSRRPTHRVRASSSPTLIVLGAAMHRSPRRGVRAAQVPLLRPGVPRRRRAGRRLRRGRRARGGRVRHHQGAHRGDGRDRGGRARPVPPGHDPAGRRSSPCSPSPSGGWTRRRTATGSTPSPRRPRPCRAARARRPRSRPGFTTTEVFPLLLFAVAGMLVFPAANDLLTLFVALEVFSLPLYLLCALARRKRLMSQEAAVKYFLLGAFSSAFLLFGIALLYGYAGSVSYAAIADVVDGTVAKINPALADTMGNDALLLIGGAMMRDGPAVQGRRGAVPHVDPGRLPGRADPGHRLHGGGDQGGRLRRAAAAAVRGAAGPALGLAAGDVGRGDRHHARRRDRRRSPRPTSSGCWRTRPSRTRASSWPV